MNDDETLSIVSKDSPGLPPRQQVLVDIDRQEQMTTTTWFSHAKDVQILMNELQTSVYPSGHVIKKDKLET